MELSGSNIKKLLMLSQNKPFSYISRNENPEKIYYIFSKETCFFIYQETKTPTKLYFSRNLRSP